MSKSGNSSVISAFWKIIVIFAFVYLILYTFEPGFIKDDSEEVSKSKIFMWSIITAVVVTGIIWAVSSSTSKSKKNGKVAIVDGFELDNVDIPNDSRSSSMSYSKSGKSLID